MCYVNCSPNGLAIRVAWLVVLALRPIYRYIYIYIYIYVYICIYITLMHCTDLLHGPFFARHVTARCRPTSRFHGIARHGDFSGIARNCTSRRCSSIARHCTDARSLHAQHCTALHGSARTQPTKQPASLPAS